VYDIIKKKENLNVAFLDLNIEMKFISKEPVEQILRNYIQSFRPNMIAVATLYYSSIPVFHMISQHIKQIDPSIIVVFGGHYPHHLTEQCLKDGCVDYCVLSEGELGLSDLVDALNNHHNVCDVEGIAFRQNSKIIKNSRKSYWDGFSRSSRLPWEDTPFQYYFREGRNLLDRIKTNQEFKVASITASRGCPNKCTFCTSPTFWNGKWRKRDVIEIISEIEFLKHNYGINTIVFNDENISVDRLWFMELLTELEKVDISWMSSGGLSVRAINDEEIICKMYASGICLFNLAIESGADETLKAIKKNLSLSEVENVISTIRRNGNSIIIGFFIVGFPFEDLKGVNKTISFAEELDLDWKCFYCFQPFPGCELYEYSVQNNSADPFNPNYGESYFAPEISHIDYTSDQLNRINYTANLRCNFLNNRNLRLKTEMSLLQAERDFLYVLSMSPDHVFAYYGLAEIMRLRNLDEERKMYINKAIDCVSISTFDWHYYLKELGVELSLCSN
jgi:radical SAM superfamily enzyme YgiQ (UPF0313 family)